MSWQKFLDDSHQPSGIIIPFWLKVKCLSFFLKGFLVGMILMFAIRWL